MHEPGTRTEGLAAISAAITAAVTTPDLHRWGRRNYAAGITLAVADTIAALVTAMLTEGQVFTDPNARLFATLIYIIIVALAASLIITGAVQTITAHTRDAVGAARADVARNRCRLDRLGDEIHILAEECKVNLRHLAEVLERRGPIIEGLPQRLTAAATRLDQLECAMGAVAEHLPDALLSQHWRGFNAAVREGLTLTGAEGQKKRRPPHIGLVAPDPDQ